ncbi:MAG: cobalamin B12-binding domain-containing protein [Deltaproteobacteria bacterium TMED126]|jgi:methylmalonyl-CoA mutase C-terminal domain/subunit|nr:cobalamin B12-binding domain-containing protein [Candidatus Dadabacteria bacterium]NSW97601.1 cobalamin B12-binding domain-containing protein [Deltaproteobacteria bacterium TMED126]|tara:strand:- start:21727 stop:22122 length:396 start_codon:yes stop_codon:yes gene_type:complete
MSDKIRILIAKAGLDGHDRGAKIITRALRDAGFEVIYTGLHQTPEMISEAALQEDVDAIGISLLSGAHNFLFPEIIKSLEEKDMKDVVVFGGGIIPDEDIPKLKQQGVKEIFGPGTSTVEMIDWINNNVKK